MSKIQAIALAALASILVASGPPLYNQTHCNTTVPGGSVSAQQTGKGAVDANASVNVTCTHGTLGNVCDVCCDMSFFLWNPTLHIWHEVTDVHCQTDWATCGETMALAYDDAASGLPVGDYVVRAQVYYGTCDAPGGHIMTLEGGFTLR